MHNETETPDDALHTMTKDQFSNLFAVTWSKSQGRFHISTIEEMLFANWEIYYGRNPNDSDWVVLWFSNTSREAQESIERFEKNMDNPNFGSTGL